MSLTPDNDDLASEATRGDYDGGLAEVLETAVGCEIIPPHKTDSLHPRLPA